MNEKTYITATEMLHDSWRLAAAVRKSGWQPDLLVGLWRGGSPIAIAIHEYFKVSGWKMQHLPLKCSSYTGIGANAGSVMFECADEVFAAIKSGIRVLVVDDVFDTGKTAAAVKAKFDSIGADMRLACVYYKPSKNTTALTPDYFVRKIGTEWLVFPHEIDDLSPEEIRRKDPFLAELLAKV